MMMRRREPCRVLRTMGAACLHMLFSPFTSSVPPRPTSSSRSYPRPAYLNPPPHQGVTLQAGTVDEQARQAFHAGLSACCKHGDTYTMYNTAACA